MITLYERLLDDEDTLISDMDKSAIKISLKEIYDLNYIKDIIVKGHDIYYW